MKPSVPEYRSTPSIKLWFSIGILVFLSALSSFQYSNRLSDDTEDDILITQDTLLSLYGAYVFNSESCLQCHVLEDAISLDALSLDGLGGKYTDIWHLWHLLDPRLVQPESGMPSYASLLDIEMDKKIFQQLLNENLPEAKLANLEQNWAKLQASSEAMRTRLLSFEPDYDLPRHSEMYALIAYLQSIPNSPRKQKIDSIVRAQLLLHGAHWDSIARNDFVDMTAMVAQMTEQDIAEGRLLFLENCAPCHRKDAGGSFGPNLTDRFWLHGGATADIIRSIVVGHPDKGMMSWKLVFDELQVAQLVAFIQSLDGTQLQNGKAPQGELQR
jgi:cytochrome c oxidase cbb3-type subunit III